MAKDKKLQKTVLTKEMPEAVAESIAKPDTEVDKANDYINTEYPWCVGSLTSPQRAMLCELYRIRMAIEGKK
jgi:hypothetical protein